MPFNHMQIIGEKIDLQKLGLIKIGSKNSEISD